MTSFILNGDNCIILYIYLRWDLERELMISYCAMIFCLQNSLAESLNFSHYNYKVESLIIAQKFI